MILGKSIILTDINGHATEVASVDLSDKKTSSMYFGTWGKADANPAEVVAWCDEQVKARECELTNLKTLKEAAQRQMVAGLDVETLRALLRAKETTLTA